MTTRFRSHHTRRSAPRRARVLASRGSTVSLGELVSAAWDAAGSAEGAALLLSSASPLSRCLSRKIEVG